MRRRSGRMRRRGVNHCPGSRIIECFTCVEILSVSFQARQTVSRFTPCHILHQGGNMHLVMIGGEICHSGCMTSLMVSQTTRRKEFFMTSIPQGCCVGGMIFQQKSSTVRSVGTMMKNGFPLKSGRSGAVWCQIPNQHETRHVSILHALRA